MVKFQLAQRGMNIILVSRTLTKLQTVAMEIEETFNVETVVIDVDFTSGPEIYDKIKERIKGKEIGVLVNNVGMINLPNFFASIPDHEKFNQDIINCNITSVAMMCSIVLPQMVQRKKGIIINISSVFSQVPGPTFCMYAASKSFVTKFSKDLAGEYEHQGIIIQSVMPGPVVTNLIQSIKLGQGTILAPSAEKFVKSAIKTVGISKSTNGYWPHTILAVTAQLWGFFSESTQVNYYRKHFQSLKKL